MYQRQARKDGSCLVFSRDGGGDSRAAVPVDDRRALPSGERAPCSSGSGSMLAAADLASS
jgi:hypothetical protein